MILYNQNVTFNFLDYGIQIPLYYDDWISHIQEKFPLEHREFPLINREDLERVHAKDYLDKLLGQNPEIILATTHEFSKYYDKFFQTKPFSHLIQKTLLEASGTYEASLIALQKGFCFYLGGGMHHSYKEEAHGFCVIHDVVIALQKLIALQKIKTAWIIDTDVHKGDGTAYLTFKDENILTLSIHMEKGWPLDSYSLGHKCWTPSTVDIPIPQYEENSYLNKLEKGLQQLQKISTQKGFQKPDIVMIVLGADPYEKDTLLSSQLLNLSFEQMCQRHQILLSFLKNIPQAYVLGGGYGPHSHEIFTEFAISSTPYW